MCKPILISLLLFSFATVALAQESDPALGTVGTVRYHDRFASKYVEPRNVEVWLPPSYEAARKQRYPVLYMHDGQNLFNPHSSYAGVDWAVDETMTRLIAERKVREAIVVGVWNSPKRVAEYMPQKPMEVKGEAALQWLTKLPGGAKDAVPLADNYLKFLVTELKPFIDTHYRTRTNRQNTFVMGSSMGGLISAYAISEYPDVFGGAGCVSTHWPAADGAVIEWLKQHLPDPRTHKVYFDYGTETLDAQYEPYQKQMDDVTRAAGYKEGQNWLTRKFVGAEHSERAWRKRVAVPLVFLISR